MRGLYWNEKKLFYAITRVMRAMHKCLDGVWWKKPLKLLYENIKCEYETLITLYGVSTFYNGKLFICYYTPHKMVVWLEGE